MNPDTTLHVIAVISNPVGYERRYKLYEEFAHRMSQQPNVNLVTVELAFDTRPFRITTSNNPNHIQLRSNHELWHKENMINIGLSRLPLDWKYAAWIDADITFVNPNWVEDTIQQLQHHKAVQLFSKCIDLNAKGEPMNTFSSFCSKFVENGRKLPSNKDTSSDPKQKNGGISTNGQFWHPGFAWGITKEAINNLGGLLEFNILGGGDHLMALSFVGGVDRLNGHAYSPNYVAYVKKWEQRAIRYISSDIGYVSGTILHHFHGKKSDRGYGTRPQILQRAKFDPYVDLIKDSQGVFQLVIESDRQRRLYDDIRIYFRSRNEDSSE